MTIFKLNYDWITVYTKQGLNFIISPNEKLVINGKELLANNLNVNDEVQFNQNEKYNVTNIIKLDKSCDKPKKENDTKDDDFVKILVEIYERNQFNYLKKPNDIIEIKTKRNFYHKIPAKHIFKYETEFVNLDGSWYKLISAMNYEKYYGNVFIINIDNYKHILPDVNEIEYKTNVQNLKAKDTVIIDGKYASVESVYTYPNEFYQIHCKVDQKDYPYYYHRKVTFPKNYKIVVIKKVNEKLLNKNKVMLIKQKWHKINLQDISYPNKITIDDLDKCLYFL